MIGAGELSRWRFASRLARREVKRRPARTVLVVALVAIPVMAMTLGSVLSRTNDGEDSFRVREYPDGTDVVVRHGIGSGSEFLDRIPASADVATIVRGTVPVETVDGTIISWLTIADGGADGRPGDVLSVDSGRAPRTGEVWLSDTLIDDLGVGIGDTLELRHPTGSWTVVGAGRSRNDFDERILVMPDLPREQFSPGVLRSLTLIDLGEDPSPASVDAIYRAFLATIVAEATPPAMEDDVVFAEAPSYTDIFANGDMDNAALAWGWVAGTIALAAMGIVIAAAFATSARRQLVTIGLLSSNGASDRLVRRTLALQGLWSGLAGSTLGIGTAVIALPAFRSTLEGINDHVMASYRFAVSDIAVIAMTGIAAATIAAYLPARTASRVPVIAALAGRRPVGEVPGRLVPTGLVLFAFGIFLLVIAATSNGGNAPAAAGVLGGVCVLAGACCASPLAIDSMSRLAAALGGSSRFAGRSLGRSRTRSAAVVTAIAVTGALALSGATLAMELDDEEGRGRILPADAVAVVPRTDPLYSGELVDFQQPSDQPVEAERRRSIESIVPGAEWHDRRIVAWDAAPFADDVGFDEVTVYPGQTIVVADAAMLDLYELSATDRRALDDIGMLALNTWMGAELGEPSGESPTQQITLRAEGGDITLMAAVREDFVQSADSSGWPDLSHSDSVYGIDSYMITEAAAEAAGLDIVTSGAFLRSDAPLTVTQRRALDSQFGPEDFLSTVYRDVPQGAAPGGWSLSYDWRPNRPDSTAVQGVIVAVALILTLLVVAIGLSLAATESRDERDVLVAIGSRPVTMRSMAGVKAVVITLTGVALAVPTGLVPTFAVLTALDEGFELPWLALGALVLVVPVVAGAAAWAVSTVAQWARPVRMSNLAFD